MSDRVVELQGLPSTDAVRKLLAIAMLGPDNEHVAVEAERYGSCIEDRILLGWFSNGRLVGLVGARPVYRIVCEILHVAVLPEVRGRGIGRYLVEAVSDQLDAVAIRADTGEAAGKFWRACGFVLRQLDDARARRPFRAERRHPPEPPGFFTAPRVGSVGERAFAVELPPPGNTLPLIPEPLRCGQIPHFVLDWILGADEVVLMMQDLAPELLPPVTPAVRTAQTRDLLGPPTNSFAYNSDGTVPGPEEPIPGLPNGVGVPMRILEIAEMGERISAWLQQGARVRAWAQEQGCGDASWMSVESRGAYNGAQPGVRDTTNQNRHEHRD